jgi:hypothetical protein
MSLMIDLIKLSCTLLLFHHFGHVQQDREESDQAKCHHFDGCTSIQDSRLIHKELDAAAAVLCIKKPYFFALVTITEKGERKW